MTSRGIWCETECDSETRAAREAALNLEQDKLRHFHTANDVPSIPGFPH